MDKNTYIPHYNYSEKGACGTKGERGLIGSLGDYGLCGNKGPIGSKGNKGSIGYEGYPGIKSIINNIGIMGERGPKGDKGTMLYKTPHTYFMGVYFKNFYLFNTSRDYYVNPKYCLLSENYEYFEKKTKGIFPQRAFKILSLSLQLTESPTSIFTQLNGLYKCNNDYIKIYFCIEIYDYYTNAMKNISNWISFEKNKTINIKKLQEMDHIFWNTLAPGNNFTDTDTISVKFRFYPDFDKQIAISSMKVNLNILY